MTINENEFFREATLRICGSIDIEQALSDCFQYLMPLIPADHVYLHFINLDKKTGTVFAKADREKGRRLAIRFDYPAPIWRFIGSGRDLPAEMILDKVDRHPLGRQMLSIIGLKGKCSGMMMRLSMDEKEVGVVGFIAKGWNRFRDHHMHLVRLLKTPFAIALSNSRRYLELLELKNLLADDNRYLQQELRLQTSDEIVGADYGLSQVMQQVHQVAPLSSPVLLLGETGVGKELIADAIHNYSPRKNGPFIKVNCGAIPDTLIDSELFGHVKGAFTGAMERRRGRFERAHKGSIFLDEIGELPMAAQLRLLRVLQEMEFEPVGGTRSIKVDIRVIAATNRNLEALVDEGRLRQDLYFRLKVFPIHIPPLRERRCDIPALTQHFILKKYREMGFEDFPALAKGAIEKLNSYDWPGNVRELENAVEKAIIVSRGRPIEFNDLGLVKIRHAADSHRPSDGRSLLLDDTIAAHIRRVLKMTGGKVGGDNGAAQLLGVNPATLRHKMRKLNIPFGRGVRF